MIIFEECQYETHPTVNSSLIDKTRGLTRSIKHRNHTAYNIYHARPGAPLTNIKQPMKGPV